MNAGHQGVFLLSLAALLGTSCSTPEAPPEAAVEYQITTAADGSLAFSNRAAGLAASFGADGSIRVEAWEPAGVGLVSGAPVGPVSLRTVAWGRESAIEPAAAARVGAGACAPDVVLDGSGDCLRRVEVQRADHVEWWVNSVDGLEQGWTVPASPAGRGDLIFDVSVEGARVEVAPDGSRAELVPVSGGRLRYDHLLATDARGRDLPAVMQGGDGAIRLRVDVVDAVWPVTVDPLIYSVGWSVESGQVDAELGGSVSWAGDVNGDGYGDAIIGISDWSGGQGDEGAAWVFHGSATGLAATADWAVESDQTTAYLGKSVSAAGDLNGDGYGDVVVGIPEWDGGQNNEGAAWVFFGSATGLPASPDWTAESDQASARYGYAVSAAGDLNGDGFGDLVVGAKEWDGGQSNEGAVFVYLGSASGLPAAASWTSESDQATANLGWSVSSAGDVNGDGYADLVAGAYGWSGGQSAEGAAFVWFGSASGLPSTPSWIGESDKASARLGTSVASAGDVNGDGYADLVAGAPYWNGGQSLEGAVFVYLGSASGLPAAPSWSDEPDKSGALLGYSVSSAGDLNGDGYADLVAGAPEWNNGTPLEGAAFIYFGSASGLPSSPDANRQSNQSGARFGRSVSAGGDVDGDGLGEVLIGAPYLDGQYSGQDDFGGAFLYMGTAGDPSEPAVWSVEGDQTTAALGYSVASAGDLNGDGFADLVVGLREWSGGDVDEGRAQVYLGSASGPAATESWGVESDQWGASLGHVVASAGDVNGDGYDDLVVGVPWWDGGQSDEGQARVFHGSASGLAATADWSAESDQATAQFSRSVASAGDVNGDGFADLVVGAPSWTGAVTDSGAAFVYLGSASGLPSTPSWVAELGQSLAGFGWSVSTAGDVNGDGYDDLAVGAPWFDDPLVNAGEVLVYLGSASGLASAASWTVSSGQTTAEFGVSVSSAGDVDGDGFGDLVVGAEQWDGTTGDCGGAFVYLGSSTGLSASHDWSLVGDQDSARLGGSVASAGDVDLDGYGDLLIGAYRYDGGQPDEGMVQLVLGSASGPASSASWTVESDQADAYFGWSVASAGDLDGDGVSDLVVGARQWNDGETNEGAAFVYLAADEDGIGPGRAHQVQARQPSSLLPIPPGGRSLATDSFDVHAMPRSAFGRVGAKLQVEAKPLDTPFDGAGLVESAAWTDIGAPEAPLQDSITGLQAGTPYHWRARVLLDPTDATPQARSRWLWGGRPGQALGRHVLTGCLADTDSDGQCDSYDLDDDDDAALDTADCAPLDPSIYPGAPELCDAIDSDCDGSVADAFPDLDGDDDPDCNDVDDDGDGETDITDCDDADASIHSGAFESCDAIDSDCDGSLVDGYDDTDGDLDPDCIDDDDDDDGALDGPDCEPLNAAVFPGATELCDGIDSDCDGSSVDEFVDFDGDGDPDCNDTDDDDDLYADDQDCVDDDASIYPNAPESCDGIDSDCDGSLVDTFSNVDGDLEPDCIDEDDDNDGDLDVTDCDDASATVYTGAPEGCDAVDSDCDGDLVDGFEDTDGDLSPDCIDPDDDGDGDPDVSDCGPLDASIFTGAPESCDAVDSDCDGDLADGFTDTDGDGDPDCNDLDDDGDGYADATDCAPLDATIHPGATELCDAIDSDCDGSYVDEFENLDGNEWPDCIDEDADGDGVPDAADCAPADPTIYLGAPEIIDDGIDQDCNGADTITCWPDADGDGVGAGTSYLDVNGACGGDALVGGDCDDADALNYPGNPELCDGLDNDCSGAADADVGGEQDQDGDLALSCADCDDLDAANFPDNPELCDGQDNDCIDGADADPDGEQDVDGDGVLSCEDCDDDDAGNFPGNPELCDGLDNDCSGAADADAGGEQDADGDGILSCEDCEDGDPLAFPGFPTAELCDGVDNDCSGTLDPDEADTDLDGWLVCAGFLDRGFGLLGGGDCNDFDSGAWPGAPETSSDTTDHNCDGVFGEDVDGDGWLVEEGDCVDSDAQVHPEAEELCDGRDTDCDGVVSLAEGVDVDEDGALACEDCADAVASVHPGADEICDGRDSDCDGLMPPDELDMDYDGVPACAGDCDDEDAAVAPGLPEDCADGLDNDCDGSVDVDEDNDGDGAGTCSGDCDDGDPEVGPLSVEQCNGVDDDCDGVIDQPFDLDGDGWAACEGRDLQDGDCDDTDPTVHPFAPPICDDGVDNDCDPSTFEGLDHDGDGVLPCPIEDVDGDCWEGNPLVYPGAEELCDWIDNDCDGQTDEFLDIDDDGQVPCEGDCEEGVDTVYTAGVEVCDDGLDGDCDGEVDEDCAGEAPDPVYQPPGCVVDCALAETGPAGGAGPIGLLLLGVMWRRRRTRRGSGTGPRRRGQAGAPGLGLSVALLVLLCAGQASAGPAEEAAMQAYGFQQEYCADVAGATSTTAAAAALQAVTPVLTHLSGIYDETEASFLLYWRGVLLQCVQNEERAAVDFEAFLEAKDVADLYPSLVSQSKQRLRSIRRKLSGDGLEERREPPTVTLGLGGGYQLNAAPGFPHHFGYAGLDVSIKLVGPLRLVVFARPAFSPPLRHESGQLVDPTQRVVLVSFGVGPALRWEGRVRPGFDLRLQLAPNNSNFSDAKLLVGALITGGLDIGLGRSPLALRPMAEVGFLGRSFVLRGGMQVVLALGPARAGGASSAKR